MKRGEFRDWRCTKTLTFRHASTCLREKQWKCASKPYATRVKIKKMKFRLFSYSQITYQLYSTKDSLNLELLVHSCNSSQVKSNWTDRIGTSVRFEFWIKLRFNFESVRRWSFFFFFRWTMNIKSEYCNIIWLME